jgi:hypothetical protein
MAGLVPAIHESDELVVKIAPARIRCEDQAHLPSARPMLDVSFASDCRRDIRMWLGVDQPFQAVALRKALDQTLSVLPGAMPKTCGYASVQYAIRPVGHDVNPGAFHLGCGRRNQPITIFLSMAGLADAGTFAGRIMDHQQEWGRWNPDEVRVYLGRLAGLGAITNDEWGALIDRAEAVLIWKIGVPFNSARIKTLKYQGKPILVVNHGRRHRLPECISTLTEFINTDNNQFKQFGPSGHPVSPPIPQPGSPSDEE